MKKQKKKPKKPTGPVTALTTVNYLLFGAAVLLMIIGYYFLSIGPADSKESLTIAPIILVIAYCIVVPLAIFWRKKPEKKSKA